MFIECDSEWRRTTPEMRRASIPIRPQELHHPQLVAPLCFVDVGHEAHA